MGALGGIPMLKDRVEFPPRCAKVYVGVFQRSKINLKGHVQMSSGAPWRIGHILIAPLADMSRTSAVQISACYLKKGSSGVRGHVAPRG